MMRSFGRSTGAGTGGAPTGPSVGARRVAMAKFALFFSYKPEAWNQMLMKPGDRSAAIRDAVSTVGGSMETLYFMFGDRDGFVVLDIPDPNTAAAVSIAVNSTGAFAHLETRQLIAPEDLPSVLEKAASVRETYRPPGE
jgi:uncharacterized protein with GYD domain